MKSYESCNWFVKMWRNRWYIYAIFLHLKDLLSINLLLDLLLDNKLDKKEKRKLENNWRYYIRHVELNKMCKLTTTKNKDINLKN